MECQFEKDRSRRIAAYLSGELSEEERTAFEEHYFECNECFSELKMATSAVRLIEREGLRAFLKSSSPAVNFFANLWRHLTKFLEIVTYHPGGLVASAALTILITVSPIDFFHKPHRSSSIEEYAANFKPAPALESFMHQTVKSTQIVFAAQPARDTTFTKTGIVFRWTIRNEYLGKNRALELRILNNKPKPLYSFKVIGNEVTFNKPLPPGLYYWALLSEGEMIYLSRFFVKIETGGWKLDAGKLKLDT